MIQSFKSILSKYDRPSEKVKRKRYYQILLGLFQIMGVFVQFQELSAIFADEAYAMLYLLTYYSILVIKCFDKITGYNDLCTSWFLTVSYTKKNKEPICTHHFALMLLIRYKGNVQLLILIRGKVRGNDLLTRRPTGLSHLL